MLDYTPVNEAAVFTMEEPVVTIASQDFQLNKSTYLQ
jgi:hypothetical protein